LLSTFFLFYLIHTRYSIVNFAIVKKTRTKVIKSNIAKINSINLPLSKISSYYEASYKSFLS